MIVVCSGCEEKMGEKEPFEDKRVSHGICQKCLIRIYGPEFAQPENENSVSFGRVMQARP